MLETITRSNAVGWQFIENHFAGKPQNNSSTSNSKPVIKIRRRTRILNKELKKFTKIKSYSQYVKIKTKILREVSEDEFIEEESFNDSSMSEIEPAQELISVPGTSYKKLSRTRKESSKTRQRKSREHVQEAANNSREKNCSRVKKNLSTILKSLETDVAENETEPIKDVDEDAGINNRALCRVTGKSRIPIGEVPLGDSGIDDNSQGNSSTSLPENDKGAELLNITETADSLTEVSDDLPNVFTQANNITAAEDENELSFSNEDGAIQFSQSDMDSGEIEESSDKEARGEELSQSDMDDDEIEEPLLREDRTEQSSESDVIDEEIEESPPKEKKIKKSSKSDINEDKIEIAIGNEQAKKVSQSDNDDGEEFLTQKETPEEHSSSDIEEDKIEIAIAKEQAEKVSQSDNDDAEEFLTQKETTEEHSSSDIDDDEIEDSSAKEERVEKLSESDENQDEIGEVATMKESAQNVSHFDDMNDDLINESWTKEESMERYSHSNTNYDLLKKKIQPTITCTEIVTSKYKIIRDKSEEENDLENLPLELEIVDMNNELTELDEISSEAERVGKLKRINLLCSGTDSDSSEDDEKLEITIAEPVINPSLSSQIISDPSDSEDSDSLALHISDSEDQKSIATTQCKQAKNKTPRSGGLAIKSIKDQIKEQTIINSSVRAEEETANNTEEEEKVDNVKEQENANPESPEPRINEERNCNRSKRKKKKQQVSYETESLQYVLKNLSKRNSNDDNLAEECLQNEEETANNTEEEEKVDNVEEQEKVVNVGEQENANPESHEPRISEERNCDRPKRKKKKQQVSYETESLQFVLNNISKRNSDDENLAEECLQNGEETANNTEVEEKVDNVEEQENGNPESHEPRINEGRNYDRPQRKKKKQQVSYKTESLQYVLNNLSKRNSDEENLAEECLQNEEENLPRPVELQDYVAREKLIPTSTSSTITLEAISKIAKQQDDDEEIWFMEIPKSIVTDPSLRGQSIVIEKEHITIGEHHYNITRKHTKSVSCILRKNKKKTRYKAVNIRPACSINVRYERMENEEFIPSKVSTPPKSVPFPKNIKSRNPLMVENNARALSSENADPIADKKKEKKKNATKRKNKSWHADNFISKQKKIKIDRSLVNGSKNGDLFNE